jgi:hypothetical protein
MLCRELKSVFLQCGPGQQVPGRSVVRVEFDHAFIVAARQAQVARTMQGLALFDLFGNQSGINRFHDAKSEFALLRAGAVSAARLSGILPRTADTASKGLLGVADIRSWSAASSRVT